MKKTIIFGGTFNPPHWGHIAIIKTFLSLNTFDSILIIPNEDPFYKNIETTQNLNIDDKYTLLQNIIDQIKTVVINRNTTIEASLIDREIKGQGSIYRIIQELKKDNTNTSFSVAIGEDQYSSLSTWKNIDEIIKEVYFYIFDRNISQQSRELQKHLNSILFTKVSVFNYKIDSTIIRKAFNNLYKETQYSSMNKEVKILYIQKFSEERSEPIPKEFQEVMNSIFSFLLEKELYKEILI